MNPAIEDMIEDVIQKEGGYVDDPLDRGGATKYGITQKTLSAYLCKQASKSDVQNLCLDTAKDIYEKRYFFGPGIYKLPPTIQSFVFDCAVNHGPTRAIKFVQHVCVEAECLPTITIDGLCGPNTQRAAQWALKAMGNLFLDALMEERRNFYLSIVAKHPEQQRFLNGWLNRVDSFKRRAA